MEIQLSYPSMPRQDSGLAVINSKNTHKSKKVKVNYIKDKYGTWIKVGMFSNDTYSKTNKTPTIFSETMKAVKVHYNLSTDIAQETPTAFSADFGELEASEVRILGATDFDRWEETRTIDWVYKVPKAGMFGKHKIKYHEQSWIHYKDNSIISTYGPSVMRPTNTNTNIGDFGAGFDLVYPIFKMEKEVLKKMSDKIPLEIMHGL